MWTARSFQSAVKLRWWPQGTQLQIYTVKREIFASSNFRGISRSISIREIKIRKIFSYFWKISVEELVAWMVSVCGCNLFARGKISNMLLSQNNLSLQTILLLIKWSMTDRIYSVSHWLIIFYCCIWRTWNCLRVFNRMFAFMLHSQYTLSCTHSLSQAKSYCLYRPHSSYEKFDKILMFGNWREW